MIKIHQLCKSFPLGRKQSTQVLDHVDLVVGSGEFVAITGPSGAGKSTLLHILGMLDADYSGQYLFEEQAVHRLSERGRKAIARENLAIIFQDYRLIGDLTVSENLAVPLQYRKLPRAEIRERVEAALTRFELLGYASRYPHQLSGGLQQLVGIARAMAMAPKLILADEPTGNLHSTQGESIMQALSELNQQGATVILVTHNQANARHANRSVEMLDGRIVNRSAPNLEQVL